jgi:lysophospholipase L1-like esterase
MNTTSRLFQSLTAGLAVCLLDFSVAHAAPATLIRESFEGAPVVAWQHTWGTFTNSSERAHSGKQSLQCTVEDKYGMSVHSCDLPAKPGATYTLTAWVFIPVQDKECFPQLQICDAANWGFKAQASPTKKGEWEQLRCQWTNTENLKTIRIALHDSPWKEGLGGATYFWDDVLLTEEGGDAVKPATKLEARGHNPDVLAGLEIKPAGGMKVTVTAGKARVLSREVVVAETTLEIAPPPAMQVTDETTTLTDEVPKGFGQGTALLHCIGFAATLPCLEPGSVVIKEKPGHDGIVYEQGKDWRADETWGRVGRLPEGRIAAGQTVYIDYRTRPLRVDTICVSPSGKVSVNQGDSQKICPSIPATDYGSLALGHIFLDYGCQEITAKEIYPVGEAYQPDIATINAYRTRVPKTREKLEQDQDVTIVAWGDSVTQGGDATRPEFRFCEAFAQALRYKYPQARIKLINAGRGGWNSSKSLPLFEDDVLKYKPDLVTMEFVNDMGMSEQNLRKNWFEAIDRVRASGGEAVIVTPHFVLPMWMKFPGNATPETRVAVEYLRKIAEEKQVAVADASKRWEHLAVEGVPYLVHLRNGINHPDDFGHALFVEELMRLF